MPQKTIPLSKRIDRRLRTSLKPFLIFIFITTIFGSLTGFVEHQSFRIGGWLINYQAGFIRRGLIGEALFWIGKTGISVGLLVSLFQACLYGLFFRNSYLTLKQQKSLAPYLFLIFSPFIFLFQIADIQGGFRKEIIYFVMLSILVLSGYKTERSFLKSFYIILAIYPLAILSHEMLAVFLPYLVAAFVIRVRWTKRRFVIISLLLALSVVSFLATILNPGDQAQSDAILSSIHKSGYLVKEGGQFDWLGMNVSDGIDMVRQSIKKDAYYLYAVFLGLSALAFLPILDRIKAIVQKKITILLVLVTIAGTIMLSIVAIDWGRWLYIHLVSWFLLSLSSGVVSPSSHVKKVTAFFDSRSPKMIVALIIIYSTFWYVPHCCQASAGLTRPLGVIGGVLASYGRVILGLSPELERKAIEVNRQVSGRD